MTLILQILVLIALLLALALSIGALLTALIAGPAMAQLSPKGRITNLECGSKLHWYEHGQRKPGKPTLLLIHGLAAQAQNFTQFLAPLLAQSHHVVTIDRPGCGMSTRQGAADAEISRQAQMIAQFIEAEQLGRVVVVGHSLGGAIALALALNHGALVGALALIAPLTQKPLAPPRVFLGYAITWTSLRKLLAYTLAVPLSKALFAPSLRMPFWPEQPTPNYLDPDGGGGAFIFLPSTFVSTSEDLIASPQGASDIVNRYSELSVPGGVLFGEQDLILNATKHGQGFKNQVPHFDLRLLPKAGHMIHMTRPQECADFVLAQANKAEAAA